MYYLITIAAFLTHLSALHRSSPGLNHSTERNRNLNTKCLSYCESTGTSCARTGALVCYYRPAAAGCFCLPCIGEWSYGNRYADGLFLEEGGVAGMDFVADRTADGKAGCSYISSEQAYIHRTDVMRCGKREAYIHLAVRLLQWESKFQACTSGFLVRMLWGLDFYIFVPDDFLRFVIDGDGYAHDIVFIDFITDAKEKIA